MERIYLLRLQNSPGYTAALGAALLLLCAAELRAADKVLPPTSLATSFRSFVVTASSATGRRNRRQTCGWISDERRSITLRRSCRAIRQTARSIGERRYRPATKKSCRPSASR